VLGSEDKFLVEKVRVGQALLSHTCNPSYSGSRDQEDHSLKPALGKQFVRLYFEKYPTKKD
jgi:hypothetical protein